MNIIEGSGDILLRARDLIEHNGWEHPGVRCHMADNYCMTCAILHAWREAHPWTATAHQLNFMSMFRNVMNTQPLTYDWHRRPWRRKDHVIEILTASARIFHDIERSQQRYMTA